MFSDRYENDITLCTGHGNVKILKGSIGTIADAFSGVGTYTIQHMELRHITVDFFHKEVVRKSFSSSAIQILVVKKIENKCPIGIANLRSVGYYSSTVGIQLGLTG